MEEGRAMGILLVDDREENLRSLETVLDEEHYELLKARSGSETLACLKIRGCSIIRLDGFVKRVSWPAPTRRFLA
jgi:CheY-like chemotaxis protein